MIKIKVYYEGKYVKKITLKGHANYAEYGSDIVCSAVSSTYLCTVNGILSISDKIEATDHEVNVLEYDEVNDKLLNNMISLLSSLEVTYPKNIHIDKEEM